MHVWYMYVWYKKCFLPSFGPNHGICAHVSEWICLYNWIRNLLKYFVWLHFSDEGIPTTSANVTVNLPQRQEQLNPEEESSVRALYTAFMPQHLQVRNHIHIVDWDIFLLMKYCAVEAVGDVIYIAQSVHVAFQWSCAMWYCITFKNTRCDSCSSALLLTLSFERNDHCFSSLLM